MSRERRDWLALRHGPNATRRGQAPVGVYEARVNGFRSKLDETLRALDHAFAQWEAAIRRMEAAG
jgi:hypothetical protein